MRTRLLITAGVPALGCLLLLGGCAVAPPPSPVERDYGLSHQLAIYGQTANPEAEENLDPVEWIDGKAALGIMSRYRASFGYVPGMDMPTEFTKQYQYEKAIQLSAPKTIIDLPTRTVNVNVAPQ